VTAVTAERSPATTTAERVTDVEVAAAWKRYLDDTHDATDPRYGEVEPWAWSRLQGELRAIALRKAALR
jgi:hypothetical protein